MLRLALCLGLQASPESSFIRVMTRFGDTPVLKEACAKADIDDIIDCEPQADSVFQVAAFDYNWPEYLVNVESRTEYLIASVSVIDKNAEMISIKESSQLP